MLDDENPEERNMADYFRVSGIVKAMDECARAWRIVRESDEYARERGFLFDRNMAGRKGKGGKQRSQSARGVHVRNQQYTGRRKMMKK